MLCDNQQGWKGGSRGRGHMCTYHWFMLIYGRNQHNTGKQFLPIKKIKQSCLKRSNWCLWKTFYLKSKQVGIKIQLYWSLGKHSDGSSQITYIPETHCHLFHRVVIRINLNKMTYKIFLYRRTVMLICTILKWHWQKKNEIYLIAERGEEKKQENLPTSTSPWTTE